MENIRRYPWPGCVVKDFDHRVLVEVLWTEREPRRPRPPIEVPHPAPVPLPRVDFDKLRSDYLGRLIADHEWLDFAGVPQVRNVVRLKLEDVFVPLSATRELPEGSHALSDPGCFISTFSLLIELSRLELTGKAGPGPVLTLPVSGR